MSNADHEYMLANGWTVAEIDDTFGVVAWERGDIRMFKGVMFWALDVSGVILTSHNAVGCAREWERMCAKSILVKYGVNVFRDRYYLSDGSV